MTTAISQTTAAGFASELAALLLENEATQSDAAHLQRDAARSAYLEDVQTQVDELNSAADATMTAAFVSAVFSIVGGACEIGGAIQQFKADTNAAGLDPKDFCAKTVNMRRLVAAEAESAKLWNALGKTSSELAQPTTAIGQSLAERNQASAKLAEAAGAQAQWLASDASSDIEKASKQSDAVLDTLQSIQHEQAAATNALIGRV